MYIFHVCSLLLAIVVTVYGQYIENNAAKSTVVTYLFLSGYVKQ